MQIQPTNAYTATYLNSPTRPHPAAETKPPAPGDRSTISQEARDRLAAQAAMGAGVPLDTAQGPRVLDIDQYFSQGTGVAPVRLDELPLLMPSQKNVDALSRHISAKMPQFLSGNDIPTAPESISYDRFGQVVLPDDYPYAEQFRQALENDPVLARELNTVNALASHVAGIKRAAAFQEEYAAAKTQAQIDATIAKYQDLFEKNATSGRVELHFSAEGALSVENTA